jgi:hypothetical protein
MVVRDAALTGGHDRNRAVGGDDVAECFDDPHRAQRIGDHQADELVSGHVSDGLGCADPGVHEEQVEGARPDPLPQFLDLLGDGDIHVLDLQQATRGLLEFVQRRAGLAPQGCHDLGSTVDVLLGDRVPKTAGCADQQHACVLRGRGHARSLK